MTRRIVTLLFLAWITGLAPPVRAQDRVILKNGNVFTGALIESEGDRVALRSAFGVIEFRREEVEKVEKGASSFRGVKPDPKGKGGSRRGSSKRKPPPPQPGGFIRAVPDTFGDLKKIRFDRHPAYDSLRRSRPGAWVLYATEAGKPEHDQERWLVESVNGNRTVVLKEMLLSGKPVSYERFTVNHLDYGPQMSVQINKQNTLGKELVRTAMGEFATLRVSEELGGETGTTRYYCAEVPILGLVKAENGTRVLRQLLRFAWEGGATPRRTPLRAAPRGRAPPSPGSARIAPRPTHPVAAAFLAAKPGDYAVWEDPGSGRLWREYVRSVTPQSVSVVMQVWRDGAFRFDGVRTYDLSLLNRDYLERIDARRVGEETVEVGTRKLACKRWRSPDGNVEFWTSPEVHVGALVKHAINGKPVRLVREVGQNSKLLER
jgi:hypothetical protein